MFIEQIKCNADLSADEELMAKLKEYINRINEDFDINCGEV